MVLGLSISVLAENTSKGSATNNQDGLETVLKLVADVQFYEGLVAHDQGDLETALQVFTPLAEGGHVEAQFQLGGMYDSGRGVLQDDKTARKWYTLAAKQEHINAQFNLGVFYHNGRGVIQDYKTAMEWYTLAAEKGSATAQGNMGVMYALGHGVLQNYVYAHMWGNIAASNGNALGGNLRDDLANKMTSSQIAKAQELASGCVMKNYKGC